MVTKRSSTNSVCFKVMWKNIVEPDSSHMTLQYGTCVLYAG